MVLLSKNCIYFINILQNKDYFKKKLEKMTGQKFCSHLLKKKLFRKILCLEKNERCFLDRIKRTFKS